MSKRHSKPSRDRNKSNKAKAPRGGKGGGKSHGPRSRSRAFKKNNHGGAGKEGKGQVLRGRVQKNPRGFAFIVPPGAEFEDTFVTREEAASLMDGDTVEFQIQRRGPKSSAKIIRVVQRRSNRLIGKVTPAGRGLALITDNNEFFKLDGETGGVRPGDWVVADLEEFPDDRNPGQAMVRESFGKYLSPKNDIAFTIARYGLSDHFDDRIMRDADGYRGIAQEEIEHPTEGRKDHRHLAYVTIDGEDAKDFDDAIYVESDGRNGFVLYVSIADVSFFVVPGTMLDKEAKSRATSVYFPGFCIPMLPEYLSNELCSLRPREDKLSLTAEIHFDPSGAVKSSKFYPSLIKTVRRLTYTQVQAVFDEQADALKMFADVVPHLKNAKALYHKLDDQRRARGVLDFNLPESKIAVDKDGKPISVAQAPRYLSHKLIEEFMIAANRAVAKQLREQKALALYRVHEPPDADKLEDANQLMKNLGMTKRIHEVSPKAFAEVLASTEKLKSATTVHNIILRLQKQARYMALPKGHFGLALNDYTHFTSPIRRYPDLVVHRALKSLTARRGKADKRPEEVSQDDYARLGEHTSAMERRATEAERFIVRRKQCWYFSERIGDVFEGTISGVTKNGLFVNLGEMAADGFVPLEFMDGFYEYDERHMALRKRPGNETLALGDSLSVEIVKVTVEENQITLGIAGKKKPK